MPNMPRATMFFSDGKYGWSESHYDPVDGDSLQVVLTKAIELATARSLLLGAGPTLDYIRVSYDSVWRDSLVAPGIQPYGPPPNYYNKKFPPPDGNSDVAYSVFQAMGLSGTLFRKPIYLSGVPDVVITDPQSNPINPDWRKAFNAYRAILIATWGFKVIDRDPTSNPPKTIQAISYANPPGLTTLNVPGHGLLTGDKVRVYGVKQAPNTNKLNGVWFVTVPVVGGNPDVNNIQLNGYGTLDPKWLGGGQIQKQIYAVKPYTDVFIKRETHRKRGRPFDSPRGRLKRRV